MSFRDQAIADLPTFINVDEFGDSIVVDGVTMACVLVNDEVPVDFEGTSTLESTLYAKASSFTELPVVRQRMVVGGAQANVIRVDQEQGMCVVRLRWYES